MATIRTAVQNLIGGVSQHPNATRLVNQCEVQDNAYSSVVDGLGKRQPTEHIQWLWKLTHSGPVPDLDTAKFHWIDISDTERYVAIFSGDFISGVKVFDISDGTEITTATDGDLDTTKYLYQDAEPSYPPSAGVPVPRDNFRCVTIADTTYIANKNVVVKRDETLGPHDSYNAYSAGSDWKSKSARRWFIGFRHTNFLTTYKVRVNFKTGPEYDNPPNFPNATFAEFWDPPIDDYNSLPKSYWLQETESWVKTWNGDTKQAVTYGTQGQEAAGYGKSTDNPPFNPTNQQFRGYQVGWTEPTTLLKLLFAMNNVGTGGNRYNGGIRAAHNVIKVLPEDLKPVGNLLILDPTIVDNVMKLEMHRWQRDYTWYREEMKVQVVDSGSVGEIGFSADSNSNQIQIGDGGLFAFSTEVQSIAQLPLVCEHGHIVKVAGLPDTDDDEYYVEFALTDREVNPSSLDNMGTGYWKEGMASGAYSKLDRKTMPIQLVREADSSPGNTKGWKFTLKQADWAERTVGDDSESSNPFPSFLNQKINDVFLWRNRLGFLSGSRVVMSEADQFDNFFRTTVRQVLDSDPIDRDAAINRPVDLQYAIPLEEQLILWSDRTQFVMNADPVLTPRTASVAPITYYDNMRDVRPLPMERGIFFPYQAGGEAYSQIRQMRRIVDSDNFDAFPATSQVPRYIKGDVVAMAATSVESALAVITNPPGEKNYVYIYKWQDVNGNRVLSAWQRFDLGPSGEYGAGSPYMYATEVAALTFFKDSLYMVVKRRDGRVHGSGADQYHLEKITFSGPRQPDTYGYLDGDLEEECRVFLDRRITEADCTVTYDSTNKEMRIRLPYSIQTDVGSEPVDDKMVIMQRAQATDGPTLIPWDFTTEQETVGSRTYSVLKVEDKSGALYAFYTGNLLKWYVGQKYTMTYQFSEPSLRESRRDGTLHDIKTGRLTLLRGHLAYEDSGYLKVTVAPRTDASGDSVVSRDTWEYVVPFLEMGMGATELGGLNIRDGVLPFGINAQPGHCTITVTNDTPYPSNPKSLELEASYTRRSRMYSR